jgi:hypothetical protein
VEITTTVALNLTFLMTLGIAHLMFLGHVLVFTSVLALVGAVRFVAVTFTSFERRSV